VQLSDIEDEDITINGGDVTVNIPETPALGVDSYYVISVKYNTGSVKGSDALGSPTPTVDYSFSTDVGSNGFFEETDTNGITLEPKFG
jgi:hypothetical protein